MISSLFSVTMDLHENIRSIKETMTIEWVLCSPHFEDIVIKVPKDLNKTPIVSQYEEILVSWHEKDILKWNATRPNK